MYPTIQYWKKKKTMKELGLRGCLWWDILRHVSLQRKGARCIYKSRMLSLNESCEITQLNTYNTLFSEMRLFFFLSFLRSCELRSPPEVFKVSVIYQIRSQASQMFSRFTALVSLRRLAQVKMVPISSNGTVGKVASCLSRSYSVSSKVHYNICQCW